MNVVVILANLIRLLLGFTHTHVSLMLGKSLSRLSADTLFPCLWLWLFVDRFLEDGLLLGGGLSLDVCLVRFGVYSFFVESVSFGDFGVFLE
jgi:hypothetical protein